MKNSSKHPKATHKGELRLGDTILECFVLETGERVISAHGVFNSLGLQRKGAGHGWTKLPVFAAAQNLQPFFKLGFDGWTKLIEFQPPQGGRSAHGYSAQLLPEVCAAYLKAREAGALRANQLHIAEAAMTLMLGFAHVGIAALIDEATGYQSDRDRDALRRMLQAYIAKELRPWTKQFPDEFFNQIYRLRDWKRQRHGNKHPQVVGKWINRFVYDCLPPGVREELNRLNKDRRHKHHQHLSKNAGLKHLASHLEHVTMLLRIACSWEHFELMFEKAFPGPSVQTDLLETEFFKTRAA